VLGASHFESRGSDVVVVVPATEATGFVCGVAARDGEQPAAAAAAAAGFGFRLPPAVWGLPLGHAVARPIDEE
jgi:hypothetical protein